MAAVRWSTTESLNAVYSELLEKQKPGRTLIRTKEKKKNQVQSWNIKITRSGRYTTKRMQERSGLSSIICQQRPVDLDAVVRTRFPWGRQSPWCHVVDPLKAQGWTFLRRVTNGALIAVRVVTFHCPFKRTVLFRSRFRANDQGFSKKESSLTDTWW